MSTTDESKFDNLKVSGTFTLNSDLAINGLLYKNPSTGLIIALTVDNTTLAIDGGKISVIGGGDSSNITIDTVLDASSGNAIANSVVTEALTSKVDGISGKGLSTNDYTSDEKTKLAGIATSANNYILPTATTSVLGGVKVDGTTITIDSNGVITSTATSGTVVTTADEIDLTYETKTYSTSVVIAFDVQRPKSYLKLTGNATITFTDSTDVATGYLVLDNTGAYTVTMSNIAFANNVTIGTGIYFIQYENVNGTIYYKV